MFPVLPPRPDAILLALERESEGRRVGVPETVAVNRRKKFEPLTLVRNLDREQVDEDFHIALFLVSQFPAF